jgi:hypothetical protein
VEEGLDLALSLPKRLEAWWRSWTRFSLVEEDLDSGNPDRR